MLRRRTTGTSLSVLGWVRSFSKVRQSVRSVETQPRQYPVIRRTIRRALLRRFLYGLYYRVYEHCIVIVA
jgi:hypothetical protein